MELGELQQIELEIRKAEKTYKELKTELEQLALEIHVLQLKQTTIQNMIKNIKEN